MSSRTRCFSFQTPACSCHKPPKPSYIRFLQKLITVILILVHGICPWKTLTIECGPRMASVTAVTQNKWQINKVDFLRTGRLKWFLFTVWWLWYKKKEIKQYLDYLLEYRWDVISVEWNDIEGMLIEVYIIVINEFMKCFFLSKWRSCHHYVIISEYIVLGIGRVWAHFKKKYLWMSTILKYTANPNFDSTLIK